MEKSHIKLPKDRNQLVRIKWAIERLADEKTAMMLLRLLNLPPKVRVTKAYLIAAVCRSERQYRRLREFLARAGCWLTETKRYELQGPLARPYMFGSWFRIDLRKLLPLLPKGRRFFKKTEVYGSDTETFSVVERAAPPRGQASRSTVKKAAKPLDGELGRYLALCEARSRQ